MGIGMLVCNQNHTVHGMELGVTAWPPTIRFVFIAVAGTPQGICTPKHT